MIVGHVGETSATITLKISRVQPKMTLEYLNFNVAIRERELNLEQIASVSINNLQMLLEALEMPLAVGPIKDEDFLLLASRFAELEWDYGFSKFGNRDDKFEFCLKLLEGQQKHIPCGAALCTFDEQTGVLDIHFVECFVRDDPGHPLTGNMFLVTLFAVYFFGFAAKCTEIRIPEPLNQDVVDYYKEYGFDGDLELLSAPFATIVSTVKSYI
ncbi:hypothetical protein [Pantoea agglomerans]|uniref:hypothetical protein n=1 Tax=Enterobacter agglomerans TaxID=549 RepID=UPI001F239F8B|nr:hypothetical protein [Pantoea agglomerans]